MIRGYRAINDRLVRDLCDCGFDIRLGHVGVLSNLDYDAEIRLVTLAERAGVTKQAVTPVVNDLVKKGYLRARPDPDDGRAKLVKLTEEGQHLIDAAQPLIVKIEDELRRALGDPRLTQLNDLMVDLLAAVEHGSPYPHS